MGVAGALLSTHLVLESLTDQSYDVAEVGFLVQPHLGRPIAPVALALTSQARSRSSRSNPYGVGYSGEQIVERKLTCPCCRTEFLWEGPEKLQKQEHTCTPCERHSRTTTLAEELETLREHDQRLPNLVHEARDMARNAQTELADRKQMDAERRAQVRGALSSRDPRAVRLRQ